MEKLYRLCEFGISISNVRKVIKYSVNNIDLISNMKQEDKEKVKEILQSEEYINGPNESVFEFVEYGMSIYQANTLFKKQISVEMIRNGGILSFDVNVQIKNSLLKIRRDVLKLDNNEILKKEEEILPIFPNKLKMNKVYKLCEYGIPYKVVKKISNYTVEELLETDDDYLMKEEIKKILETEEFKNDSNESVYELFLFGLSINQIEVLKRKNIIILDILFGNIEKMDIARSLKNEIYVIRRLLLAKYNDFSKEFYEEYLNEYIKNKSLTENKIEKQDLYESLKVKEEYNIELFETNLKKLEERNNIIIQEEIIEYNHPKLLDKISELQDESIKEMIFLYLNGETLLKIGAKFGYKSGDPISKNITKVFELISPVYEELKYKEIFEKYDWDKKLFSNFWNEEEYVYEFLKSKFKKGNKNPYSLYANEKTTEYQKDILDKFYGIVEVYGEKIYLKRKNLFKIILKNEAIKPVKIKKIIEIFNSYAEQYEIEKIKSIDLVLKMFNEYKSFLITDSDEIKYYDYFYISLTTKLVIKDMLDITPGMYGAKYFYNKYQDFFSGININNAREVHSLFRLIGVETFGFVTMSKYPHINIKINDRKDFFESILNRVVPIKIDNACAFFSEYYGIDFDSAKAYIGNEFFEYIKNGIIDFNIYYIEEEKKQALKNMLVKDLYSIDDIEDMFKQVFGDVYYSYLNRYNLSVIGYIFRGEYIIKNKYLNICDYIEEFIKNIKMINRKDIPYNTSSFVSSCLRKMEKNYDIIKTDEDIYINFNVLENAGITKEDLIKYANQIKNVFAENEYFTMKNVRERIPPNDLDEEGFSEKFYESVISNSENVRSIKFDNNNIHYIKENNSNLKRSNDFMEYVLKIMMGDTNIIEYNELIDFLEEEYGLIINDHERIRELIRNSGYYYNDIFRKIYKNKNIYLESIYN